MEVEIEKLKAKQIEIEGERDAGLQKSVRESSEHEKLKARVAEDERQFRSAGNVGSEPERLLELKAAELDTLRRTHRALKKEVKVRRGSALDSYPTAYVPHRAVRVYPFSHFRFYTLL